MTFASALRQRRQRQIFTGRTSTDQELHTTNELDERKAEIRDRIAAASTTDLRPSYRDHQISIEGVLILAEIAMNLAGLTAAVNRTADIMAQAADNLEAQADVLGQADGQRQ